MSERRNTQSIPPLTTQILTNPNSPVFPLWPPRLRLFPLLAHKKRRLTKAALRELSTRNSPTISPPPLPQQPVSSRRSPCLRSSPARSPRCLRYRCKHPRKDADSHPRASPARWFRPAPSSPYKADDDDHCGSTLDLNPPGRTRPCPAP